MRDGVVERQAERLMSLFGALVVEEIRDDIIADREERAARCIRRGVAVGTSHTADQRSWAASS